MIKTTTAKIFKLTSIALSVSIASGCSMLPDFLKNSDTSSAKNAIAVYDANRNTSGVQERLSDLENRIADWEAHKENVLSLAELESDLHYIIYQAKPLESKVTPSLLDVVSTSTQAKDNTIASPVASNDSGVSVDKFSSTQDFSQVKVQSAKKINVNASTVADKFSSSQNKKPTTLEELANYIDANDVSMASKFSDNSANSRSYGSSNNIKPNNTCKPSSYILGKGYAIHLASFSNENTANKELKKFVENNSNISCGKVPLIKDVNVNAKQFYSLRLGPFENKNGAVRMCDLVKKTQSYCGITTFDGGVVSL